MRFPRSLLLFALATVSSAAPCAESAKMAAIPARMQELVDRHVIAGAVTLVEQHGKTIHLAAVGSADIAAGRAMKTDDLFWIASMTKPMTAACVMMLADEGKLALDDPVGKFIPEFHGLRLRGARPPRPVTIRDLLTHTGGLGSPQIARKASLEERVIQYAHAPMKFGPGTRWDYSNGGFNTLGRIVEIVGRRSFATFLRERLLSPLGMKDTTFWPSPRRCAKAYRPGSGRLEETSVFDTPGELTDRSRPALPAGGLFSTASDVARFYRMILDGGRLGGRRFLKEQTVRLMTRTQTGSMKAGPLAGMGWGLGFGIVKVPKGATAALSSGSFGHGGSFATQSWADPKRDAILVMMIQRAGFPDPDATGPRAAFQNAAAAALQ